MTTIRDFEPEPEPRAWSQRRIVFLSISGGILVAFLFLVRQVLLPFVLALIVAYVLMPLVTWTERRTKLKRAFSILSVYGAVVLLVSLFTLLFAPRLYEETMRFARETPALLDSIATAYGPRVEGWVNSAKAPGPTETVPAEPSLLAQPRPDGSLSIEVRSGVTIVEEGRGRYRVLPGDPKSKKPFRVEELKGQSVRKLVQYLENNLVELVQLGRYVVAGISRAIFLTFMVLMVAGYLMHTKESVLGFFQSLIPERERFGFRHYLVRLDRGLSGVVRGQLLICVVNGVLSALGFWLFGLKYWPVLALVAAMLSIIPIFGAILSSIPAVAIGLTQDLWTAVWVLLWILGIHQIEANFLNPKIIGVAAKIHPVLVVFSLLVGEHYFGLFGALLAVPVLSITQSTFNHFRFSLLEDSGPDSLSPREML